MQVNTEYGLQSLNIEINKSIKKFNVDRASLHASDKHTKIRSSSSYRRANFITPYEVDIRI